VPVGCLTNDQHFLTRQRFRDRLGPGFRLDGGFEDHGINLVKLANSFWSYGSAISLPVFDGGLRRAQLQRSWSVYRETEDKYRTTVLNAFREVEDALSLTNRLSGSVKKLDQAVEAALQTQNLTMDLYKGGLNSSLDLIYAQVATLTARIDSARVKMRLLRSTVDLIRALGGGWQRGRLPGADEIQPFDALQYEGLERPAAAGGISVPDEFSALLKSSNVLRDVTLTKRGLHQRKFLFRAEMHSR